MSVQTITTEAHQITLTTGIAEDQIALLRAETGVTWWMINSTKLLVEASSHNERVDFSGVLAALMQRGTEIAASLCISRSVIPV